jgi:hypothetical protein
LEQARLGVANATLSLQDANLKLLDVVKQGPEAVQAEIQKLRDAQVAYGDTSGKIQEQIDKLVALNDMINGTPTQKGVNVTVDASQAFAALTALSNALANMPKSQQIFLDVVATPTGPVGIVGIG